MKHNLSHTASQQFTDQFKQDDDVYVNGARGCSGPFKVDVGEWQLGGGTDVITWLTGVAVLGNGSYKLRGQKGEKMKKIYEEDDLSRLPRTIS